MDIVYALLERLALNAYVEEQYEKAAALFTRMEKRRPGAVGPRYNRALALLGMQNYDEAQQCIESDIESYGPSFARFRVLGDIAYMRGNREQAAHMYAQAAAEAEEDRKRGTSPSPALMRFLSERISICTDTVRYENALAAFPLIQEGNEAMRAKKYDEAFDCFSKAAQLDPLCYPAVNNMGVISRDVRGDNAGAKKLFERALLFSDDPGIAKNLAKTIKTLEEKHGGIQKK